MRWIVEGDRLVGLELTRRNLETLLAKLDRNARRVVDPTVEESAVMITKMVVFGPIPTRTEEPLPTATIRSYDELYVHGVENDEHYSGRPAGEMHPEEETVISKPETGVEPA